MSQELENPELENQVLPEGPLKQMLISYVGEKLKPENNMVTVMNIVQVLADEFPEFLFAVAEENFIRGYEQAFADIEKGQQESVQEVKGDE
jgi:hypothetical protein